MNNENENHSQLGYKIRALVSRGPEYIEYFYNEDSTFGPTGKPHLFPSFLEARKFLLKSPMYLAVTNICIEGPKGGRYYAFNVKSYKKNTKI